MVGRDDDEKLDRVTKRKGKERRGKERKGKERRGEESRVYESWFEEREGQDRYRSRERDREVLCSAVLSPP